MACKSVPADDKVGRRAEARQAPANDVDHVIAAVAMLEAQLQTLVDVGIDAITTPSNRASFLLQGAQEELRQREERSRLAIHAAGCVIWDWDGTTDRVTWAGPLEELFGYRPERIKSTFSWWRDHMHPDDREAVGEHFAALQRRRSDSTEPFGNERWIVEYRFCRADGTFASVRDVHTLCGSSDRHAARMIGAITDITQQKLVEDRWRRSEAHLKRAQRLTSLGSFEFDGVSGELRLSDEAYRVFGVERETFTHNVESIRAMIHPADIGGVIGLAKLIGLSDAGLATRACDFRMICPDGQVRIVRRECDPVFDLAGRISGFFGTFQDISRIRAAEEKRRELEFQLLHAQKVEALGTLAGGIAHDLNNTLVPVISLAELMRRDLPDDSADGALLEVIRQSGERARDLVSQILTFIGRQKSDKRSLDLAALLRESMRLIRAGVLTTIQIRERIEAVPPVLADKVQIHQVILNLVTNAAQAIGTEIGTITIELSAVPRGARSRAGTSSGDWLRISVSDTGCGMDAGLVKRVFDPFFTTKGVGEGTGLGLSVVRDILTAHGGHTEVQSTPGGGSRFDVFLPVAEAGPADDRAHGGAP